MRTESRELLAVGILGSKSRIGERIEETPADLASAPSLFTAIQEQLGLRLEARKEKTEVLVIDHVEKPDAN
jgi:uncharacterized protein (TIGR03435 family)